MSAKGLAEFISKAVSPYHTVEESRKILQERGFERLEAGKPWKLKKGGRYYVIPFKTEIFAFTVPSGNVSRGIRIAAAHTDYPCLHLKPKAETISSGYMRLNTEVYGGPILNTWLDRPLSLAGRVLLKSKDVFAPKEVLVDFARPVVTIPNLAIHYNREVNKGVELTKQNDMLPLLGVLTEKFDKDDYFLELLAKEIVEKKENILDFDIIVYNAEKPAFVGAEGELLSCPRLDNITSCFALVEGITGPAKKKAAKKAAEEGINLIALFDNEEIGSGTKQGADSALLEGIIKRINTALGRSDIDMEDDIQKGFLLSVDVAHALHPAKAEKFDRSNCMLMGEGVTFKLSANQRYSYDAVAVASLQQLCDKSGIRYRKFVNHSDMPGGGTLGPIISSWLPMYTVDIGVPILAMHSSRELMAGSDQDELEKLMKAFFA